MNSINSVSTVSSTKLYDMDEASGRICSVNKPDSVSPVRFIRRQRRPEMLLPCPECNYRCSQSAKACPSCGHPFKEGELRAPGLVRVKLLTILALAVLLGAIVMLVMGLIQFQPYSVPPESTGGFSGRVMALEFVQTPSQANVILGDATSPNRAAMRNQIYVDFVWIVCYLALFLLVANFLRRRRCPWAYYLSW